MPTHDIIVIGASAGGVEALIGLVKALPSDLPASIFVVIHFPPHSVSVLPQILIRNGSLSASHPIKGQHLEKGRIYVAPPDRHMLLRDDGLIVLTFGPRENGFRPAVDPLFRSAAHFYGPRTVGVILSGTLGDGVAGLRAVKIAGGKAIVQDPKEAVFDIMPLNAIDKVDVDFILPLKGIAKKIIELSHQPVSEPGDTTMFDELKKEESIVQNDLIQYEEGKKPTESTVITCPECGGVMWELRDGELLKFRCHVGHAYSSESLMAEQAEALEAALWAAVRALVERAVLVRRMGHRLDTQGGANLGAKFLTQADEIEQQAGLIRQNLLDGRYSDPRLSEFTPDEPNRGKAPGARASADRPN